MGLLEQEIKELRQMNAQLMAGKITPAEVNARVGIYSQTEKRIKHFLSAYSLAAKHGKGHIAKLANTQLIGDGSVIDLDTEIENESIKCPDQDKVISRLQCKDYSERTGHLATCQSCPNFEATRKLMAQANKPELTQETSQGMLS